VGRPSLLGQIPDAGAAVCAGVSAPRWLWIPHPAGRVASFQGPGGGGGRAV